MRGNRLLSAPRLGVPGFSRQPYSYWLTHSARARDPPGPSTAALTYYVTIIQKGLITIPFSIRIVPDTYCYRKASIKPSKKISLREKCRERSFTPIVDNPHTLLREDNSRLFKSMNSSIISTPNTRPIA